jgi:hypothetical protein
VRGGASRKIPEEEWRIGPHRFDIRGKDEVPLDMGHVLVIPLELPDFYRIRFSHQQPPV